jgi:two-component system, OmpR family, response regulator RegX3
MRVLLVEDDDAIAEPLTAGLGRRGFQVSRARTGAEALAAAPHDVVLLDLGLPDMDGIDVCQQLRASSAVPIIVVTARSEEVDRVLGLELGADDYVVKPFGFRELVARIRAVTRRARPAAGPAERPQRVGRLELDRRQRQVRLDEAEVTLTAKEFDLLACSPRTPERCSPATRSWSRSGTPTGSGQPRPWTCTWPRCARSWATPAGSRRSGGSASGW